MKIDADLIAALSRVLHYGLTAKRAAELAREAQSLQDAIRETHALEFDDEPAAFLAYLETMAR